MGKMLVALRTFTAEYDGDTVTITAGRDRVDPSHPLVARYPDAFKAEHGARRRRHAGAATPAPAPRRRDHEEVLPRPSWALDPVGLPAGGEVALRAGVSPFSVRITDHARASIEREIAATPADFETGGLLLGLPWSYGCSALRVTEAWGPGPVAIRGRRSLVLDWTGELARAAAAYERSGRTTPPTGVWHTHPAGGDAPSTTDLQMFAAALRAADQVALRPTFVAVIATPPAQRWQPPRLSTWIVRRDRRDLVCERAR